MKQTEPTNRPKTPPLVLSDPAQLSLSFMEKQPMKKKNRMSPAKALQMAFDHFNKELFGGQLPPVMLAVSRNANIIGGYYSPGRWTNVEEGGDLAELAINANLLDSGDPIRIFGILIHEMSHHWQWYLGKPGRSGYHNEEWAAKAKALGLKIKTPDGKETGQAVSTEIIIDGPSPSADAFASMPDEALLPFIAKPLDGDPPAPGGQAEPKTDESTPGEKTNGDDYTVPKSGKRSRYTCPMCGTNAWGKGGLSLICGPCSQMLVEASGYKED